MSDFNQGYVANKYFDTYMYYPEYAYPEALRLMEEAVRSEREDEIFYQYLLGRAPDERHRRIIEDIRDDERKHNRMFREIYYQLTGREIPAAPEESFQNPPGYLQGIEQALFGELGAVEKYRMILFGLVFLPYRNMLTEIITDELKHAAKWNYLFTLNSCRMNNPYAVPVF